MKFLPIVVGAAVVHHLTRILVNEHDRRTAQAKLLPWIFQIGDPTAVQVNGFSFWTIKPA